MGLKSFTIKNDWLPLIDTGWGNGYVILPKGHPDYGKEYDQIDVSIHGGLTFGSLMSKVGERFKEHISEEVVIDDDSYIVGFDTCHYNDNKINWSELAVKEETENLRKQLEYRSYSLSNELTEFLNLYNIKQKWIDNTLKERQIGIKFQNLAEGFLFNDSNEGATFWVKYNLKWHKFLDIKRSMLNIKEQ